MTETIIKRYLSSDSRDGRRKVGILLSAAGILFNLLLFLIKYAAGSLSGSIAITADGFNNLADSCSCILALLGFKLGGKHPTEKYPMGYGRFEYLSGLLISAVILIIGGRMLLSSVGKILHPASIESCPAVIVVLLLSILIKGTMYLYNSRIGRLIRSSGMRAAALDSLSDCIATLAILASIAVERFTGFHADGYTGLLVALCILYAGGVSVKESLEPLLGRGIDSGTRQTLMKIIQQYGITEHSGFALHDYGPHQKLLTFTIPLSQAEEIPVLKQAVFEQTGLEAFICPCGEVHKSGGTCQK